MIYFIENEKYKIRFNRKSKHFSVIIGADKDKLLYLTLTHSNSYKNKNHWPLLFNPNKNDSKEAFVVKKIKSSKKTNFEKIKKNYILSALDKVLIDLYIVSPFMTKQQTKENKLQEETKSNVEIKKEINIERINEQNKNKESKKEKIKDIERER